MAFILSLINVANMRKGSDIHRKGLRYVYGRAACYRDGVVKRRSSEDNGIQQFGDVSTPTDLYDCHCVEPA